MDYWSSDGSEPVSKKSEFCSHKRKRTRHIRCNTIPSSTSISDSSDESSDLKYDDTPNLFVQQDLNISKITIYFRSSMVYIIRHTSKTSRYILPMTKSNIRLYLGTHSEKW